VKHGSDKAMDCLRENFKKLGCESWHNRRRVKGQILLSFRSTYSLELLKVPHSKLKVPSSFDFSE
jgi:hypothetical protein